MKKMPLQIVYTIEAFLDIKLYIKFYIWRTQLRPIMYVYSGSPVM